LPAATAAAPGGVDVAMKLVKIPDQKNVAVVEGEEISTAAYQQELNRALVMVTSQYGVDWNDPKNQTPLPSLQQQVLDQMIERVTLRQLAGKESVSIDPQNVETETVALQSRVQASGQYADWATFLKQNNLTDESVRSLIADNLLSDALQKRHSAPTSAEQVHASHILVATQETAQEVLDKLSKGETFASLAAQYSTDTGSKDQGGDLGWFPRGVMVAEFEQAAFSLEPGKVSQPVKTQFGYHIILVQEKAVRELDPTLYEQVQQKYFQTWIAEQQAKMKIERLYTFAPSN
jgi:foldase protein PrsA